MADERQSYQDIAENGPDETAYNNMEVAAKAEGPVAELRRREMAARSDAVGALVEAQAAIVSTKEQIIKDSASSEEEIADRLRSANEGVAQGAWVGDFNDGTLKLIEPHADGSLTVSNGAPQVGGSERINAVTYPPMAPSGNSAEVSRVA